MSSTNILPSYNKLLSTIMQILDLTHTNTTKTYENAIPTFPSHSILEARLLKNSMTRRAAPVDPFSGARSPSFFAAL